MGKKKNRLFHEPCIGDQVSNKELIVFDVVGKMRCIAALAIGTPVPAQIPGVNIKRKALKGLDQAGVATRVFALPMGDDQCGRGFLGRRPQAVEQIAAIKTLKVTFECFVHLKFLSIQLTPAKASCLKPLMDLIKLVATQEAQRDSQWENQFFKAFSEARVNIASETPIVGPDNWPYLLVETDPEATEPVQNILHWLSTRGLGLVVNSQKEYPDFIFTYGMLWNFRETGYFVQPASAVANGAVQFDSSTIQQAGAPHPKYLPDYVRSILRQFFLDQGVMQPKILVMSQDRVHYDLTFSLESLGNPKAQEYEGLAEAISWFLPPHYSIVLASEKGLPDFINL